MNLRPQFEGTSRFEIVRLLGAGGMGEVYEALDHDNDSRVAIKVLRYRDPRFLNRFKREFRALEGLSHPNLAALGQLHDSGAGGEWFFTMELVDGVDLLHHVWGSRARRADAAVTLPDGDTGRLVKLAADELDDDFDRDGGPLAFDDARLREALRQLADALVYLHAAGKVHRDIKPSNVMVDGAGRVVLLDFGLMTDTTRSSLDGDIVGTPAYMAPEQAARGQVDPAADCYALGVLLYEGLTGHLPFEGTPAEVLVQKLRGPPPDPRTSAPDVADDLAELAMRLLVSEPTARATASDVLAIAAGRRPATPRPLHGRRTAFFGRDRELAALTALVHDVTTRGAPRALHLIGESGVGKSALVAELFARRGDDLLPLVGRCYEREMTHYRALDGVVDAIARRLAALGPEVGDALVPADASLLARMFPVLGALPAFAHARRVRSVTEHESRLRAGVAFRELLHRLTRHATVVIAIDDVQWADRDSLRLLAELLRGGDAPAIAWLFVSRPRAGEDGRALAGPWLAEALATTLDPLPVAPLDPVTACALAASLLDDVHLPPRAASAAAIAREAAGHPLHIAELVRHAGERARTGGETPLRLDDAIRDRLARLPARTQDIARLLAVAGAPVRPQVLRRAAQATALEVERALSVLRLGHLARRSGIADDELVEPYHDRVRESLIAGLDDDARRGLHERLAGAMTAAGEAPEILLRHLEGAGDRDRAAVVAATAAERASASMAYDRAADLYRTAIELGSYPPTELRALHLKLGEELVNAGHGKEAAAAFERAADGADPETRLECKQKAAEQLLINGWIEDGLAMLDKLLDEISSPLARTSRRALVSLLWHRLRLRARGLRWKLRREAQVAREDLVRLDVYKAVSNGLSFVDTIRGADFTARYLRFALEIGEPVRLCRALGTEALFLGSQGVRSYARAQAMTREIERVGAHSGHDQLARAWSVGVTGALGYFVGRFEESARGCKAGEELFRALRVVEGWEPNNLRMFQIFTLSAMGWITELAPRYAEWLADAEQRGDRYVATVLRRRSAILWLHRGDAAGALDALTQTRWMPPEGRYHLQHWYELQARAEAALVTGDAAAIVADVDAGVQRLRDALLARVMIVRVFAEWLQARVHLAASGGADARRTAQRLARRLRGTAMPVAVLFAELVDAGVAAHAGDRDRAVTALRGVIAHADGDTRLHAAAARIRLAGLIGGDEGRALTAAAAATAVELGVESLDAIVALYVPGFAATRALSR